MGRLPDGRAVFVPFALPGERAQIRLTEEKKGYARGVLLELLEESPRRIPPRCAHFAACGGCHYQHMSYDYQLEAKTAIVRDQLERIGGLANPRVENIVPSPKIWNYRNNVQFHLTPEGKLGFQEPHSNQVIPVEDCPLAEEPLNEIWPRIEMDPESGVERISLRLGDEDDVMLVLEGADVYAPEFSVEELPISAVYLGPEGPILLAGGGYLIMEAAGRQFKVSAESFFQVNSMQAANMVKYLQTQLPLASHMTLLELFSGVGLFSAFLAPQVDRFVAVESAPTATMDFEHNLGEFDHVELYETTAEIALANLELHPDLVLADPPRAGLGRKVVAAILDTGASVLAYVSCDPATLARDARQLTAGGFHLEKLTPFDMFPQTYHIESISFWRRS